MNNTWNWTVFQLMTQSAIQEQDEMNKREIRDFVDNLLNNSPMNLPSMYK